MSVGRVNRDARDAPTDRPRSTRDTLDVLNRVGAAMFAIETLAKIYALGLQEYMLRTTLVLEAAVRALRCARAPWPTLNAAPMRSQISALQVVCEASLREGAVGTSDIVYIQVRALRPSVDLLTAGRAFACACTCAGGARLQAYPRHHAVAPAAGDDSCALVGRGHAGA